MFLHKKKIYPVIKVFILTVIVSMNFLCPPTSYTYNI